MNPFVAIAALLIAAQPATQADTADGFALHLKGLQAEAAGDRAAAHTAFEQACEAGVPAACTMAGLNLLDGARTASDFTDAAAHFAQPCLAGDDFACERTGFALGRLSTVVPIDSIGVTSIALLQMGEQCRHANGEVACLDAAALLRAEELGGADMALVRAYATRACDNERVPGCGGLVAIPQVESASSETRDADRCAAARADGCDAIVNAALQPTAGDGAAAQLGQLAAVCAEGVPIACAGHGLVLSQGPEALRDLTMARSSMRTACDGFVAKACLALGVMYKKGVGGAADPQVAVALVDRACVLGLPKACTTLAEVRTQAGEPAAVPLRRACRLGNEESCEALRAQNS